MPKSQLNVAVIGATGAVGDVFLRVAAERNFPFASLKLLATARSAGKVLRYKDQDIVVEETTEAALAGADLVFCSATSGRSRWSGCARCVSCAPMERTSLAPTTATITKKQR